MDVRGGVRARWWSYAVLQREVLGSAEQKSAQPERPQDDRVGDQSLHPAEADAVHVLPGEQHQCGERDDPEPHRVVREGDAFVRKGGDRGQTPEEERENKERAEQMIDTYLAWHAKNENQIADIEMKFAFNLNGRVVKGFIDRVERTPEGNYVVIDFKTGSASETKNSIKENIQMNVYCLAILDKFGALPLRASLFYVKHEKMVDYVPDSEQLEKQKMRLIDIIDQVLLERFPGNPSYQTCRFCDYEPLCEEKEMTKQR